MADRSRARTLAVLAALYFAQGLPFGFQSALRSYLRASGVSLVWVGFAGALALPWMAKALWAPLVDRFGWARFGRRRSWIVPLQALLALTCAAAAFTPPSSDLRALLLLVFLMNLFAATQDIAVDGLAVDLLGRGDLGPANAAQVVGFKAGMLTAGGLLVYASAWIGWRGQFAAMAALILAALFAALALREPPPAETEAEARARRSLREVVGTTLDALRGPGALWLVAFVGTYKLGEAMVDAMFHPFLIDAGFTVPQIGLWLGTYGMAASIAGSLAGGVLAQRVPLLSAVAAAALLRSASMGGEVYLALVSPPPPEAVVAVTVIEHFCGGALTTAMFAFMMSRVRKAVGATHYTLLASVEVLGKSPAAWLSGVLAVRLGYAGLFALGTALSFGFLVLLVPLRRREREAVR